MDINLRDYGNCQFVSGRHASIFHDRVTGNFHLLNYSPYGTAVDRTLYGPDLSKANPTTLKEIPIFLSDIQAIRSGPEGRCGMTASKLVRDEDWINQSIQQKAKKLLYTGDEVNFENEESVETTDKELLLPRNTTDSCVHLTTDTLLTDISYNNSKLLCNTVP